MYGIAIMSVVITIFTVISSPAAIINIPAEYPAIQQGIDAASDGDTVLVQPGTYLENLNFSGHNIVLGSLFLTTGDDSYIEQTIIDGDSAGSVVILENSETNSAVLTGFTIQNGSASLGAGIRCNGSDPVISHNIITGNIAYDIDGGKGGGVFCYYSNAIVTDNVIRANYAEGPLDGWGGGIYCGYFAPTISRNIVTRNLCSKGGGIYCLNSNPLVNGNLIYSNTGIFWGGGFYLEESGPLVINNTIYGNVARWSEGGAFYLEFGSNPIIVNSILWADSAFSEGDEIYVEDGFPVLTYTDIQGGWQGMGNMDTDPYFRDEINNNFHLMSTACGDHYDSPCIDAGDPTIIDSLLSCEAGLGTALSDLGAYGGGDSLITDVYDNSGPLAEGFALSQNYPNPFNARTSIRYVIPSESHVTIEIFDLLGRKIEVLIDRNEAPGMHSVLWDAGNVSSGLYFYRIKAGDFQTTRIMSLIK